jgi:hypothetical protein
MHVGSLNDQGEEGVFIDGMLRDLLDVSIIPHRHRLDTRKVEAVVGNGDKHVP